MNIFRQFNFGDQNIIKNEAVFSPDFAPTEILHREKEIKELVALLSPYIKRKSAPSIILFGPSGSGKTTLVKFVTNQLKESTTSVFTVYVNCAQQGYRYAILTQILTDLGYAVSRRGRSADELLSYIITILKKENKSLLVILDDIDFMRRDEMDAILFDIVRLKEYANVNSSVITITTRNDFLAFLNDKIRSSLLQAAIKISPYNVDQLADILEKRAELGFFPQTWDREIIRYCAAIASKRNGDARLAINILWLAAKEAEKTNSKKIEIVHVDNVKNNLSFLIRSWKEQYLSLEERKVLEEIKKAKKIISGDLYARLKNINERTIRNYINRLKELDLIDIIELKSSKGNTRLLISKDD